MWNILLNFMSYLYTIEMTVSFLSTLYKTITVWFLNQRLSRVVLHIYVTVLQVDLFLKNNVVAWKMDKDSGTHIFYCPYDFHQSDCVYQV